MKDLAARGHELTVLTTDLIKINNPNVTQIDLHSSYEVFKKEYNFVEFSNKIMTEADHIEFFSWLTEKFLDEELSHPEVKKLITERDRHRFDVMFIEQIFYTPMLAFAELYDIPVIAVSTTDMLYFNHKIFGNEANLVLHPEIMFPYVHKRLNIQERWQCLKYLLRTKFSILPKHEIRMKELVKKHFPTVTTDLDELNKRIEFAMVNSHPALGYIRPLVQNTIQLGFMHIEAPKQLPDGPLKKFLDNSKHGVIYMSLGSNVQSKDLGMDIQNILLNVFGSLKYDVIWKFESDDLLNIPKNLLLQKWLPQADLLAHPKVKLFITQGGQQSMEEAIDRAVPTIVIPFIGDQTANAIRMEIKNIGKRLDLKTLTEEKLKSTIEEILNPKYKENVINLRNLIYDQPMTSREKAVWWTEYVIRHKGAKHFYYTGKDVPIYEKYFLDFAAIAIVSTIVVSITAYYAIKKIISKAIYRKNKTD